MISPDDPPPPDAAVTPIGQVLTHSSSQDVSTTLTISCVRETPEGVRVHRETRFFRVFDLPALGIDSDFAVSNVEVGIRVAQAGDDRPNQVAEVRLHTFVGALLLENLELIRASNTVIPNSGAKIHSVAIQGLVPAGSKLAVEFFLPDGLADLNLIEVGVNTAGQSAPCYLVGPVCDIPQITDTANLGFGDRHLVMNVMGKAQL